MDLIPANSITFELIHVAAQRCECGGAYAPKSQQLLTANDQPIDRVSAACDRCGAQRDFFFDIHTFYGQEDSYDHFQETEAVLQRATQAIHAHRWDEAEAGLRRVIDPQEGEPAFCWGHYHLGMVLMVKEQHKEGLAHIQRAIALSPREAEFYRGLAKALAIVEQEEEAAEAQAMYETLKARREEA